MAIRFGSSSSINSSYETLGCEFLPLSRVNSIEDGALRFYHVASEEKASRDCVRLIVNRRMRCRHASIEVHRVQLISAVRTL